MPRRGQSRASQPVMQEGRQGRSEAKQQHWLTDWLSEKLLHVPCEHRLTAAAFEAWHAGTAHRILPAGWSSASRCSNCCPVFLHPRASTAGSPCCHRRSRRRTHRPTRAGGHHPARGMTSHRRRASTVATAAVAAVILAIALAPMTTPADGCFTDDQRRLDSASRAFLSPFVVSAHLLRKSPVFGNKFTATFRVARLYKARRSSSTMHGNAFTRLRKRAEVVVQFWSPHRQPQHRRGLNCLPAARALVVGKKYFVFADTTTWNRPLSSSYKSNNASPQSQTSTTANKAVVMSAYNEPVKASNKNRKAIKGILCRKCGKYVHCRPSEYFARSYLYTEPQDLLFMFFSPSHKCFLLGLTFILGRVI